MISAKRYERLMKAHGVNPSGGTSPSKAAAGTPKGKTAAATTPKSTPKGKKRKMADVKDEDDDEDVRVKDQPDLEEKKADQDAKRSKDWVDDGSWMLRNIPPAPKSLLEALELESRAAEGDKEDDDSCIVVDAKILTNGHHVKKVPRETNSEVPCPTPTSTPPPSSDSHHLSSFSAYPPYPLYLPVTSFDFTTDLNLSPQSPTASPMKSSSRHIMELSHTSPVPKDPANDFTRRNYPSGIQLSSSPSWVHVPASHHILWNPHHTPDRNNIHRHGR